MSCQNWSTRFRICYYCHQYCAEKLINDRLMYWLHRHPSKIFEHQFGFTPQVSAEDAANEVARMQKKILDGGKIGLLISLDISAAFDTAWWDLILVTLRKYDIPGNLYRVISDYLSDRQAKLPLCGNTYTKSLDRGCPQGAKCSPLLWNLLYSGLLKKQFPIGCHIQAFADDALLVIVGDSTEE